MAELEALEERFPSIDWREPVPISVAGGPTDALCCRVCIATKGLPAIDVAERAFASREDFLVHLRTHEDP